MQNERSFWAMGICGGMSAFGTVGTGLSASTFPVYFPVFSGRPSDMLLASNTRISREIDCSADCVCHWPMLTVLRGSLFLLNEYARFTVCWFASDIMTSNPKGADLGWMTSALYMRLESQSYGRLGRTGARASRQ